MSYPSLIFKNQQDTQIQDPTNQLVGFATDWFDKNVRNPIKPIRPDITGSTIMTSLGLNKNGFPIKKDSKTVDKPTNSLNDFTKNNSGYIGTVVNAVEPMMQLAGAKQADNITAGEQVFSKGSDLAFNEAIKSGNLAAILATGTLKGIDWINRYAGSTAKDQLTIGANTGGYQSKIESKAGTKGTLLMGDIFGGTKRTNKRVDNANAFNTIASYAQTANNQNNLSAQNTFYDFQEKNKNKLNGGISTNMLTAKKGAKINPAQLRNLVHKAQKGMKVKPTYEEWYKTVPEFKNSTQDYDLQAAYNELPYEEMVKFATNPEHHLGDTYKKPSHFTFSTGSKYHSASTPGGTWTEEKDGTWNYTPSKFVLDQHGGLENYKKKWDEQQNPPAPMKTQNKLSPYNFFFKEGGKLNVIPEGALHARKHNLDVDFKDSITDKGIPVITFEDSGEVKQHAEIELNEIIFHKDVTDKLEAMFKKYKETESEADKKAIAIECGKFLASEILENTDDRTGLIEKIE